MTEEADVDARAAPWLRRLDAVESRLRSRAVEPVPATQTSPDPGTGERWDAGQVWAHLQEFCPYWVEQVELVLAADDDRPAGFGRTKGDPGRVAAIEARRSMAPPDALPAVAAGIAQVRGLLTGLDARGWERQGRHPTLGVMGIGRILEEFLVGHLEQHADQLDELRGAA